MSNWQDVATAPQDGTPILARVVTTIRFKPYKPGSRELRRGVKGRWQQLNMYGGWDNCDISDFSQWQHYPEGGIEKAGLPL